MPVTFANLPQHSIAAINELLYQQSNTEWIKRAERLHEKYTSQIHEKENRYITDMDDVIAYLALRMPATYAQHYATFLAVQELYPHWEPQSVLDIGCGPGTGIFAAKEVWPSLTEGMCLDRERNFLQIGQQLLSRAKLDIQIQWEKHDVRDGIVSNEKKYDVVIVGNVFNELQNSVKEKLLGQAFNKTKGVLIIIEPGTPYGSVLIYDLAKKLSKAAQIAAPFVGNSLVTNENYWVHFSQKFIRPDFERRVRQHMRTASEMASDWEDAKFCYVAISNFSPEVAFWGRCVGPVNIQKGYVIVPVLTKNGISMIKVMKRNKEHYHFAKELKWGQIIASELLLIAAT